MSICDEQTSKKTIIAFLLKTGILYNDRQDWLYKLNTDKLGEYSIRWNAVNNGDLSSLNYLYNLFMINFIVQILILNSKAWILGCNSEPSWLKIARIVLLV